MNKWWWALVVVMGLLNVIALVASIVNGEYTIAMHISIGMMFLINYVEAEYESSKKYSVEEIKQAFWDNFHEAGEVWFNYLGDEERNTDTTQSEWADFLEWLEKTKQKRINERRD